MVNPDGLSMKIAIVIVSMDSPELLRRHLEILSNQTKKPSCVIIVNNGKKPVDWAAKEFSRKLRMHFLAFDNIGPAGGFKEGAKKAYAEGYDFIIFADDDAQPTKNTVMECFFAHAENGDAIVAGYNQYGYPLCNSNHYTMVRRDILARIGFYFDPLFFLIEDVEYTDRLLSASKFINDKGIAIEHPVNVSSSVKFNVPNDSFKTYLANRNKYILMAIDGNATVFCSYYIYATIKGSFSALVLRKPRYFDASIQAFVDFMRNKLDRKSGPSDKFDIKEISLADLDTKRAVLMAKTGGSKTKEFENTGIEIINQDELISDKVRRMSALNALEELIRVAFRWTSRVSGKDMIIADQYMLSFPPFSTLARRILIYDEFNRTLFLFYENNQIIALAFDLIIIPLVLITVPLALGLFLLKKGYYKKLFERKIADDIAFCKAHSKS